MDVQSIQRSGDRRADDRRGSNRRRQDRRAPAPPWRRPAAYVGYGVLATIVLVLLTRGIGGEDENPFVEAAELERTVLAENPAPTDLDGMPVREAYTLGQYEALLAEGDGAVGQLIRAELFCEPLTPVSVREVNPPSNALVGLIDGEGRVGGAECRWGAEARSEDFLLVIPPPFAEEFARMPEVELGFVRYRQVPAQLEWLGRSEDLSLRTAGVLRAIDP